MSRSVCGATLVRSRLRVTAKGCAVRTSVRSGRNLTIGARSPGGEPSAAAESATVWDASGWAGAEGFADAAEGFADAFTLTDCWLRGRTWLVALDSATGSRSEEHTSELQSHVNLVCRLLLEK